MTAPTPEQVVTGRARRAVSYDMFAGVASLADAAVIDLAFPDDLAAVVTFSRPLTAVERQSVLDILASVDDQDMVDRSQIKAAVDAVAALASTPERRLLLVMARRVIRATGGL